MNSLLLTVMAFCLITVFLSMGFCLVVLYWFMGGGKKVESGEMELKEIPSVGSSDIESYLDSYTGGRFSTPPTLNVNRTEAEGDHSEIHDMETDPSELPIS